MTSSTDTPIPADTARVAVTGAAGKLGREVVAHLVRAGVDVRASDLRAATLTVDDHEVEVIALDLTQAADAARAVEGCNAVIHLAAIPHSVPDDPFTTVHTNVMSGYAVVEQALRSGVRRFVLASSGSIYGTAWSPVPLTPPRLPYDEDLEPFYLDEYAFTKDVLETVGAMAARRGAVVFSMRFHWIATADELRDCDPTDSRSNDCWGYVEIHDAARAVVLALEATATGEARHRPLVIAASDTTSQRPTADLLAEHLPDVPVLCEVQGHSGLYDTRRAEAEIGWQPRFSWR